ncbi:CNNM protein [Trypanosoma melophagium]|uniref:CNNM protein n=1 Tax=Trypanosoma melophagium TaxID=715481 RepID=UPI003519D9B3|nr:CNNM protein [Trypanosoma melophagium]
MSLKPITEKERTAYLLGVAGLIIFMGITAGLQVALFSIDRILLRILSRTGSPKEQKRAFAFSRVIGLGHWTVVALLISNVAVMIGLPILIKIVFDELTALLVSVSVVFLIGDVIPLSVFIRWPIPVCSFFLPFVWVIIAVTAPVSYPVGKFFDLFLGHKKELLQRDELASFLVLQQEKNTLLRESEVKMVKGALRLSSLQVKDCIVTTGDRAFMLSSQTLMNEGTIENLLVQGYSLELCFTKPRKPPRVGDLPLSEVLKLSINATLYDSYLAFKESSYNMAVVYDTCGVMCGLWTLTDLLSTMYCSTSTERGKEKQECMPEMVTDIKVLSVSKRYLVTSVTSAAEHEVP